MCVAPLPPFGVFEDDVQDRVGVFVGELPEAVLTDKVRVDHDLPAVGGKKAVLFSPVARRHRHRQYGEKGVGKEEGDADLGQGLFGLRR